MTPDRFHRLKAALERRQTTLTVLMENVHKPHNYSAVLRTCDAVGIDRAHAISTSLLVETFENSSASAARWVDVEVHGDVAEGIAALRGAGFAVVAAHLGPAARDFRDVDYTAPTAVLLGSERDGVSEEAARLADAHVRIPMQGLVGSLNVSVACAVILFEAQRQRAAAGLYDRVHLPPDVLARKLFEWAYPDIAEWCRRHRKPYPPLDEHGAMTRDFRAVEPAS